MTYKETIRAARSWTRGARSQRNVSYDITEYFFLRVVLLPSTPKISWFYKPETSDGKGG